MNDRNAKRARRGVKAGHSFDHFARRRCGPGAVWRIGERALVQIDRYDRRVGHRQEFVEIGRQGSSFAVHKNVHGALLEILAVVTGQQAPNSSYNGACATSIIRTLFEVKRLARVSTALAEPGAVTVCSAATGRAEMLGR